MKKYLWVIVVVILIVICALGVFLFNKGKVEDVTTNAEEFKTEIRTISEKISGENNVGLLDINYEYIEFVTDNEYLKSLNNEIKNRAEERVNNFKDYKSDAENVIGTDLGTQLPYVYDNKPEYHIMKEIYLK